MMKRTFGRIVVLILALSMILTIFPTGAFAEESEDSTVTKPVQISNQSEIMLWLGDSTILTATNEKDNQLYWHVFDLCRNWITPSGLYLAKHEWSDYVFVENEDREFDFGSVWSRTDHDRIFYFEKNINHNDYQKILTVGETFSNPAYSAYGTGRLIYSSYNPDVATVDNQGNVTALSEGMTRIYAKDESGTEIGYDVYVKNDPDVKSIMSSQSLVMSTGTISSIHAITVPVSNNQVRVTSLTNSNPDIAEVYNYWVALGTTDAYEILVRAKKTGTTTVTCQKEDGSITNCTVTVVDSASSLNLNKSKLNLGIGESSSLYTTNTEAPIRCFMSSDDQVVQVDDNGNVYGISLGSAKITAYLDNGQTAVCDVTVNYSPAASVKLSETSASVEVDSELYLSATVEPYGAQQDIIWKSSDKSIATVTDGVVKGMKAGNATITATSADGKAFAACAVTVTPLPAKEIPIYRLYLPLTGEHLYTPDYNEYQTLYKKYGWGQEGVAWYAPETGDEVYRLYNPSLKNHLYTTDKNEVKELTTKHGWVKDNNGEALYYSGGTTPIYRVYNKGLNGLHHLTTDLNEYKTLPKYGWKQEGSKLKAVALGVPYVTTDFFNK